MSAVNFAAMRHRVTLEQAIDTPGPGPGPAVTRQWAVLGDASAAIVPMRARGERRHGRHQTDVTHRIRLRYRADWQAAMRIRQGGRIFGVIGVINVDEANRVLEFQCREVVHT